MTTKKKTTRVTKKTTRVPMPVLVDVILARLNSGRFPVVFESWSEPEDIPYRGNCSAVDAKSDAAAEKWIADELASGNAWAWCHVTVTARFFGIEGSNSLGACSYASRADFENDDGEGYYSDMKREALLAIARQLAEYAEGLHALGFRVRLH